MMKRLPIIGVMGSRDQEHPELTVPLGEMIARKGCHLLTGGGQGVMLKVSEAFCAIPRHERQGVCIGIIPTTRDENGHFIERNGYPNKFIEIPIVTPLPVSDPAIPDLINRNHVNILSSDVIIALPGGVGTANEIELAIKFKKPLILLDPNNVNGCPSSVPRAKTLDEIEKFIEQGF